MYCSCCLLCSLYVCVPTIKIPVKHISSTKRLGYNQPGYDRLYAVLISRE